MKYSIYEQLDRILSRQNPFLAAEYAFNDTGEIILSLTTDRFNKAYRIQKMDDTNMRIETIEDGKVSSSVVKKLSMLDSFCRSKIKAGYEDISKAAKVFSTKKSISETTLYKKQPSWRMINGIEDTTANKAKIAEAENVSKGLIELVFRLKRYTPNDMHIFSRPVYNAMITNSLDTLLEIKAKLENLLQIEIEEANIDEEWCKRFNQLILETYKVVRRTIPKRKQITLSPEDDIKYNRKRAELIASRELGVIDKIVNNINDYTVFKAAGLEPEDVSDEPIVDFLSNIGISLKEKDDELIRLVKTSLGGLFNNYVDCVYVTNLKTQSAYNTAKNSLTPEHSIEHILWHGSTNNNWFSLITTGLDIKYSASGMFGKGLYFARNADKSRGYTSSTTAKWRNNGRGKGTYFLGLYKVLTGNQYHINTESERQFFLNNTDKIIRPGKKYDSVYAHKGSMLHRDEFIVYQNNLCTIYALVECKDK